MGLFEAIRNNTPETGIGCLSDTCFKYRIVSTEKPVIVTFPPSGVTHTIDQVDSNTKLWGFDFLCRYDVNIISFGCSGEVNYFKSPDFVQFIQELSPLMGKFSSRLGYGFSRGGFGIGAYGTLLDLNKVLLVHPISTKNRHLVPWDTRPSTTDACVINWHTDYSDVALPRKCKVWIMYDPLNKIDSLHAKRFITDNVNFIKMFGLSHGTGIEFLISNSNQWPNIIKDFINNDDLDRKIIFQLKRYLRASPEYIDTMLSEANSELKKTIINKASEKIKNIVATHAPKKRQLNSEAIDALRDMALVCENSNLDVAFELMKLAHAHRPGGPFIKQKLIEYELRLNGD